MERPRLEEPCVTAPLSSIRVVDCSAVVSGPLATTILADQGADVLKVEPLGIGDILRHVGSHRGGMSGMFHVVNRGKRSLALNLAHPRGREILVELVRRADVFVQNFRPGVVDRMGIGWEALRAENPRLVYVSISGFGSEGPYAAKRVYDNVVQAYSGLAAVQGGAAEPALLKQLACDKLTSLTAAQAICAALIGRGRDGRGRHVELSMLDAAIAFLWPDAAADAMMLGDGVTRQPPIGANYGTLRLADGFATATVLSDAEFQGLCRALGLEAVASDPRFATVATRMNHFRELVVLFQRDVPEAAAKLTRTEIEEKLAAHEVPVGIVRRLEELHEDPQVRANGTLFEREHPQAGRLREPRPAARFDGADPSPGAPGPRLGEHTDAVLAELGLAAETAALRAAGIVG
jgi:crotonobetainyl-CoA:carnitine CoA-transferase CaiB-like acyl-CoA transferase